MSASLKAVLAAKKINYRLEHLVPITTPLAIVLGSEGAGMSRIVKEKCDFLVKIPMLGEIESLNVSVAAGVLLYERVRQQS